jgi:hypothetical protein
MIEEGLQKHEERSDYLTAAWYKILQVFHSVIDLLTTNLQIMKYTHCSCHWMLHGDDDDDDGLCNKKKTTRTSDMSFFRHELHLIRIQELQRGAGATTQLVFW